jgi:hypothetical protein
MPVDTIPSAEECNCFAVRAAARHVTQFYDQVFAPWTCRRFAARRSAPDDQSMT